VAVSSVAATVSAIERIWFLLQIGLPSPV
jgi:hypothetical protein